MDQIRKRYTQEDKELIEKFVKAKATFSLKPEKFALLSHLEGKELFGRSFSLLTYIEVSSQS